MKSNPRVDIGLLVLRVGLGLVLMYYGAQKLFGAFGGDGPKETIDAFHKAFGVPMPLTILAMVAEFFGGLGLVVGLATQVAAFGVACTMAVAAYENWKVPEAVHGLVVGKADDAQHLFFPCVILLGAFALLLMGAGSYSLDGQMFKKKRGRR